MPSTLPFLFENVAVATAWSGTGPEAYWMAEQMSQSYIAFARTGNPNTTKLRGGRLMIWRTDPPWSFDNHGLRQPMVLDNESKVLDDPRSEPRKMFAQVPYQNPGT